MGTPLDIAVQSVLCGVYDPEIPALSIVDLGMISHVHCTGGTVSVGLMPTFMGCPAIGLIQRHVERTLLQLPGVARVSVELVYDPPWTSDRISETGKRKLLEFGIAPPPCSLMPGDCSKMDGKGSGFRATCPYCGSKNVVLNNLFGPTACLSLFHCNACRQPFEAMKAL